MIINEQQLKENIFNFLMQNVSRDLYKLSLKKFSEDFIEKQDIYDENDFTIKIKTVSDIAVTLIEIDKKSFKIKYECSCNCNKLCVHVVSSLLYFISNYSYDYYNLYKKSVSPLSLLKRDENIKEIYGFLLDYSNVLPVITFKKNNMQFFLKQYVSMEDVIEKNKFFSNYEKSYELLKDEIFLTEFIINENSNYSEPLFFVAKGKRSLFPVKLSEEPLNIDISIEKLNENFSKLNADYEAEENIIRILNGIGKRIAVFNNGEVKILQKIFDFKMLDEMLSNNQVISNESLNEMIFNERFLNKHNILINREEVSGFDIIDKTPEVNIYLDVEGKLLKVKVMLVYDDFEFNILNKERIINGNIVFRNETEYLITDILEKLSEKTDNEFYFLSKENAIYFLINVIHREFSRFNIFGEEKLTAFRIRYPSSSSGLRVFTYKEWFEIDADLSFDNLKITLSQLVKNIKEGKRYVKLSNNEYGVIPEHIYGKIARLLEVHDTYVKDKNRIRIHKINSIDNEEFFYDIPFNEQTLKEIKTVKEKLRNFNEIKDIKLPAKFDKLLRDYQKEGVKWFYFLKEYYLNGILADEMGLGKTVQALTYLRLIKSVKPNLVIMPTSLLFNWENEIKKFSYKISYLVLYGKARENFYDNLNKYHLILTTYNIVRVDIEKLKDIEFNYIVLDESQYIKNPSSVISRYIKRLKSEHRLSLTGTPFENSIVDIWSQFDFLHPGLLGTLRDFKKRYSKNIDSLKKKLKPLILRRKKEDVLTELPPKTEINYFYEMNEEQREFYDSIKAFYLEKIISSIANEGIGRSRLLIIDGLLRLRQICCHPKLVKFEHLQYKNIKSEKFENFKKLILTLLQKDAKTVVYSQFVQMLKIIKNWCKSNALKYEYIDGAVKNRIDRINNFQKSDDIKLFLISTKAGGLGINLTAAENVIIYDPWWNPSVENQAIDRIHRIGQEKKVFAYKLLMKNSVEEKILELQNKKKNISEKLLDSEKFISALSKNDIEFIFS